MAKKKSKPKSPFLEQRHIVSMTEWDEGYINEGVPAFIQGLRTTFSCVFEGFSRELSSHYIIHTNCNALYSPIHYRKVANM